MLPAIAICRPITLTRSWEISRGNGWWLILIHVPLPLAINYALNLMPNEHSFVLSVLYLVVWMMVSVIETALLSFSYRFLINLAENDETPSPVSEDDGLAR